ncbi:MAG: V-type ATP synthase subunit K [Kiritimatiellia bacterium]|nr:V-type ATP synthase subunit K [Lentisphaerota bacterium]
MTEELMVGLGRFGAAAAMAFAAMGSALGIGAAGAAAVGAWKKCFAQGKAAPFILITFVGAPLSQTIYGMILMNNIIGALSDKPGNWPGMIGAGVFGGIAMGMSAWWQGIAGAGASDAMGETGKGFGNYLMVLGVVETVALFVMVFITAAIR